MCALCGHRRHIHHHFIVTSYFFKAKTTTCAATVLLFGALTYQVAPGNGTPSCPVSTRPIQVRKVAGAAGAGQTPLSPENKISLWLTIPYFYMDSKGGTQAQVVFPSEEKVPNPSSYTDAHGSLLHLCRKPALLGRRAGPPVHRLGGGMLGLL